MPTSVASGSQSATISTEHTLGSAITTDGVYVLVVDAANMANGDTLELRAKTKARSGGTLRTAYRATFANVQDEPIKYSIPVPVDVELQVTLKQTAGTGRSYEWSVLKL